MSVEGERSAVVREKWPTLVLPIQLSAEQIMVLGRVIQQLPLPELRESLGFDDCLSRIHDNEREADFAARYDDFDAVVSHCLKIATDAINAAALILENSPKRSTQPIPTGIGK